MSEESTFSVYSFSGSEKAGPVLPIATMPPLGSNRVRLPHRHWLRKYSLRIIYVVIGIISLVVWIGVIISFANKETKAEKINDTQDLAKFKNSPSSNFTGQLILDGTLREFDTDGRSMTVQWAAQTLQDNLTAIVLVDSPLSFYRDLIIFNESATAESDFDVYTLDNITAPSLGTLGFHAWDSVDTDIDMLGDPLGSVWTEPQFGYPYDSWSGSIVLVTTQTDPSQPDLGAYGIPVTAVTLGGSILNWNIVFSTELSPTCENFTLSADSISCEFTVNFTATRPAIVRFVVIVVVLVNWISTIVIFLLTGEAVLLHRKYLLEGTDILSVCFAALFALPTVRSILPGAPDQFGAVIDLIGILPNVIIVSFCTMVFAGAKLNMRIQQAMEKSSI